MKPNASILAIGTELTTGQITNRNAAWLSEKLGELSIPVVLHETVADDRGMIRNALDRCSEVSQFIFVTGGLGPTTDDFTREVIAEWLNQPLQFQTEIWDQIVTRLTALGIPVAESNRQQCYFPRGSQIIPNPKGTAAGFTSSIQNLQKQIWVFPGPPNEVSAVWKNGAEEILKKIIPPLLPVRLLTWQCLGKSEAELGEITETALMGSGLQTGYRAHRPYVEIKVWCPESDVETQKPFIERLEKALEPWILTRQGEDLAKRLLSLWKEPSSIQIFDSASGGLLATRLGQALMDPELKSFENSLSLTTQWAVPNSLEDWIHKKAQMLEDGVTAFFLAGFTLDGKAALGLKRGSILRIEPIQSPYRKIELLDRMRSYSVEIALKKWLEWMDI